MSKTDRFSYVAFVTKEDEHVEVLHSAWTLTDPRFHPEDYATRNQLAKSFLLSSGRVIIPNGSYRIMAEGVCGINDGGDPEKFVMGYEVTELKTDKADEDIVNYYTSRNPARRVFLEISISGKKFNYSK